MSSRAWFEGEGPAAFVDGDVVGHAQQRQVREIGRTVVLPVLHVVGVAAGDARAAAGEHAVPVTDLQRTS